MDGIPEVHCVVCGPGPEAERAQRGEEYFSTDYVRIPTKGVCEQCQLIFWQAITGVEPTSEA
jgi:hypothetical protein